MGGGGSPHQAQSTTSTGPWAPSSPVGQLFLGETLQSLFPGASWLPYGIGNIGNIGLPQLPQMPASFNQQLAPSNAYENAALSGFGPVTQNAMNLTGMAGNAISSLLGPNSAQNLVNSGNTLAGLPGVQQGLNTLRQFASGSNLYPQSNPMLTAYYNAAAQPYVQNFQNAVMPGIMANAAGTGSVGGTGYNTGIQQAQFGLGQGLSNLGASIFEPAYQQAQQLQFNAASELPQIGMNLGQLGLGLGNQQISAASAAPGVAMGMYGPLSALYSAGATQQQGAQTALDVQRQNAMAQFQFPFSLVNALGNAFGATSGAGGSTMSTQPVVGGTGVKL